MGDLLVYVREGPGAGLWAWVGGALRVGGSAGAGLVVPGIEDDLWLVPGAEGLALATGGADGPRVGSVPVGGVWRAGESALLACRREVPPQRAHRFAEAIERTTAQWPEGDERAAMSLIASAAEQAGLRPHAAIARVVEALEVALADVALPHTRRRARGVEALRLRREEAARRSELGYPARILEYLRVVIELAQLPAGLPTLAEALLAARLGTEVMRWRALGVGALAASWEDVLARLREDVAASLAAKPASQRAFWEREGFLTDVVALAEGDPVRGLKPNPQRALGEMRRLLEAFLVERFGSSAKATLAHLVQGPLRAHLQAQSPARAGVLGAYAFALQFLGNAAAHAANTDSTRLGFRDVEAGVLLARELLRVFAPSDADDAAWRAARRAVDRSATAAALLLVVADGPGAGRAVLADRALSIVVGKAPDADLSLADAPEGGALSRYHARIDFAPPDAAISDLGSKNGTYVNDVRVGGRTAPPPGVEVRLESTVPLSVGDTVWLGDTRLALADGRPAARSG